MTSRGKFMGGHPKFFGGSGPPAIPLAPPLPPAELQRPAIENFLATVLQQIYLRLLLIVRYFGCS